MASVTTPRNPATAAGGPPPAASAGRRRAPRRRTSKKKIALGVIGVGVLLGLGGVGYAFAAVDVPPAEAAAGQEQATIIQYADGTELGRIAAENRVNVPLSRVPQHVIYAVLAAENRGFYTDPGISPRGIARALLSNVREDGLQGGSTITQQYAKNAFLTQERTYSRKVKEVIIAIKLDRTESKADVLERYLNTIYFGRGALGIQAASEAYFGKDVKALNPAEGAILASVIRSPARYEPSKHPERLRGRYAYVLDGMADEGWLDRATAEDLTGRFAQVRVLPPGASRKTDLSGPKGYIIDLVRDELLAKGGFDESRIDVAGYRVRTTIVRTAQEAAVKAVEERLDAPDDPQGALVSVEPGTGAIKAYYGGRGNKGGGFDFARDGAGRQPGSSFKPYVLAAALEEGISLRSRYNGASGRRFDGLKDPVDNFDDRGFGRVDLIDATRNSINTIYVELAQEVGPQKVAELARRSGIPDRYPLGEKNADGSAGQPGIGIGLGIYEVSPLSQAVGFATFAAGGVRATPFVVQDVREPNGEVVYAAKKETARAFGEDVAADAVYAMQQVVERGTGTAAELDGMPAAGKTGSTSDNKDAWFVGFTPAPPEGAGGPVRQLSTAVWLGYPTPKTMRGVAGVGGQVTGGSAPAAIWKAYSEVALAEAEPGEFPEPEYVGKRQNGTGGATESPRPRRSRTSEPEPSASTASPEPTTPVETTVPEVEPTQPVETSAPPPPPPTDPPPSDPPPTQPPPTEPPPTPAASP